MVTISDFEPWWRFGFALLIGALIGLEREYHQQKEEIPDFAGIRTFSLIALLGSVSSFLTADFGIIPAALALGGLIIMTAVSYSGALLRSKTDTGITTEVAAILTFLFGALVMGDHTLVAIALAVVTSLLLSLKGKLHGIIRNMGPDDIHVTLQFALLAAVILPLLPNQVVDPWGILNPFQIWLMVVFVSGIGFSGYILMKILGPTQGINITGILGGLASSTATTISFSSASREFPEMTRHYSRAVVLASTIMIPRVFILILIIHTPLALRVAIPMAAMVTGGLLYIFIIQKNDHKEKTAVHETFEITNPLKLSTAIKFGLLFAIVLVVVDYAQQFFGSAGVYLASLITGLTDADAITLSITRLVNRGQLTIDVAGVAIMIAVLMNTVSKGIISYFAGSTELREPVITAMFLMVLVGLISGALVFFVF